MTTGKSTILCAMPETTFHRMFTPELAARLDSLGDVRRCYNGRELPEEDYAVLWAEADAAITGWGFRPPSADMLERAPRLKAICHTAGSVRMIPKEAFERGLIVTTARAAIARTVAEYCLLTALTMLRRMPAFSGTEAERGRFYPDASGTPGKPANETLFGKTIGLIGYGCVGRELRALLRPFACRVLVYDPFLTAAEAEAEQVEKREMESLIRSSKVISLHAPEVPETRGMIGARELSWISNGAVFINSARGRLVDTEAFMQASASGRFYAALDVTDPEPLPPDHPLRSLPNVLLTPHVAGPTEDDLPRLTSMALNDLEAVLSGRAPRYPVTLEAYNRMSY